MNSLGDESNRLVIKVSQWIVYQLKLDVDMLNTVKNDVFLDDVWRVGHSSSERENWKKFHVFALTKGTLKTSAKSFFTAFSISLQLSVSTIFCFTNYIDTEQH